MLTSKSNFNTLRYLKGKKITEEALQQLYNNCISKDFINLNGNISKGYPAEIATFILSKIDNTNKEAKIVVLNDLSFHMYNKLTDAGILPENILLAFGKWNKDGTISDNKKVYNIMKMYAKANFVEFKKCTNIISLEEMFEMKNMKFDYIIANPPYGKCSRLVKKILVTICNAVQCENIISLNPPVGFEDCRNNLKDIYNLTPEEIKQAFPDAGLSSLSIGTLDTTRESDNNILIDLQHKIAAQEDAIYWVEQYNKGSNLLVEAVLNRNPTEENKEKINSKKYFLYGVWDLVGSSILTANRNCLVVNLNYDRKQLVWAGEVNKNGNDVYAFYLGSEQARNNFRDVFFANPTKGLFKMLRENSSELKQSRKGMWDMLIVLKGSHTWETINNHPLWSIDKDAAVCSVLNENDDGKQIVDIYNRWKELENENE